MRHLLLFLVGCSSDISNREDPSVAGSVAAHNLVRAPLNIPPLVYDGALAEVAADWADVLDDEACELRHNLQSPYGENLYWTSATATPNQVVDAWADEEVFYDYDRNSCAAGEMCGHYTQVVWDSTERVGCAKLACAEGGELWMCTYDPPGNWVGERPY